jgi:transcriptional regulator GlxA family with amidase domain
VDIRIQKVISIVEGNLSKVPSIVALSKTVNLSPARFRQLFKEETGLPPIQYIRLLRVKKSSSLLRTSFLSIKEVAFQSGWGDVSHFVRDFKRHCGLTPSEFRVRAEQSLKDSTSGGKLIE